jgi:hypothetical protein
MKLKHIAAVCAALGSSVAMAAPLSTTTGVPAGLVTYYIAGASAQAQAVAAVLPTAAFFATPADVVKLTGGSVNDARFGMSNPAVTGGVSKPLLIVYRNSNGSGSGVRQLLAKGPTFSGTDATRLANIAAIPNTDNTGLVTLATCGATTGGPGTWTAACTSTEARAPDVALSDVATRELAGTFPAAGANYYSISQLNAVKNALQGFGVAANAAAYAALQQQNANEGSLPASCVGSSTIACQPSIRRADYASLISAEGSIKDSGTLFNGAVAADEVTVCRRTDLSGTQASSNTFFLNNVCGNLGYAGAYNPLGAGDSAPGTIVWNEASSTGNAKACLNTAAGYRLGVLSLENIPAGADTYKFVKLDGVSPNNTYNGTAVVADGLQRQQFANGSYPYAYEMYSATQPGTTPQVLAFASALNTKLGDSTQSNLVGIAYFDIPGTFVGNDLTNKQTKVVRNGNNCGPLLP